MGPRLFRRGNEGDYLVGTATYPLLLQWGHAFSGVETSMPCGWRRATRSTFNGATPFQAWKPGSMPETKLCRRDRSFNGATPFQAWKPTIVSDRAVLSKPLQWGHAFSGVETCLSLTKPIVMHHHLQWGHAFSGVETLTFEIRRIGVQLCLQWGHAFSGVETYAERNGTHTITSLQWGHAFSGVETVKSLCSLPRKSCVLQWGHAFSGVETFSIGTGVGELIGPFNGATPFQAWKPGAVVTVCSAADHPSMGPRLFRRGNSSHPNVGCTSGKPSMGPRLFRRGNASIYETADLYRRPLQWGHAFSGVETRQIDHLRRCCRINLQWGHAFSGVETSDMNRAWAAHYLTFNGATPFQAWKRAPADSRG